MRCVSFVAILAALVTAQAEPTPLIGYTEFRTNLPGGRHGNVTTMRAITINADGTGRRVLADELTREKHSWTQFAGWSPDGKTAQLTETPAGSLHYHPRVSPDGKWLAYGSKRGGIRQLYRMRLEDRNEQRLTDLPESHTAMWPHWQPGR